MFPRTQSMAATRSGGYVDVTNTINCRLLQIIACTPCSYRPVSLSIQTADWDAK